MIYLDTSILVAYYCPEALSVEAERLVRARVRPSISDLTEVELVSAVVRAVSIPLPPPMFARRALT